MKKLSKKDIEMLLLGNSWFATGGGFPSNRAAEIFKKIFKKHQLWLKNLEEFEDRDYLCVASGVGSIKHTDVDITKDSTTGIKILEKLVGHKIKGIVSGEIGLECIAAETASKLNLPVVNSDMKGGRAAPEPSINMFNLKNKSVLPVVAINTDGDVAVLKNSSNPQKIEIFLRSFANMAQGCFVAWNPKPSIAYKKCLINGTISRAIRLGKMIGNNTKIENILKEIEVRILFRGKIVKIQEIDSKGFLIRKVRVISSMGIATLFVKNENLALVINNKVVVTCPDLITLINPKKLLGIHNSQLKVNMEVIIIGIPANRKWHTKRGYEIFGPDHFQLPFNIKRI